VFEVERERGRIGLRLADDPSVAGKTAEEIAAAAAAGGGNGGGRDRDRGGRESRGSGRPRHRGGRDPERS
jgi:polyribonucleotide nucleotidyltransferase